MEDDMDLDEQMSGGLPLTPAAPWQAGQPAGGSPDAAAGSAPKADSLPLCPSASPGAPGPTKDCTICRQTLPWCKFPLKKDGAPKGSTCLECDGACESLQRSLQARWGKALYKERYKLLKQNREMWVAQVLQVRAGGGQGRGTKRVRPDTSTIDRTLKKGHSSHNAARRRWMTLPMFEEFSAKAKGGGLSAAQALAKWQGYDKDLAIKRDHKGVVRGVGGQLRLNLPTVDEGWSDDEEGEYINQRDGVSAASTAKLGSDELKDLLDGRAVIAGAAAMDEAAAAALDEALGFTVPALPRAAADLAASSPAKTGSGSGAVPAASPQPGTSPTAGSAGSTPPTPQAASKWDRLRKIAAARHQWADQMEKLRADTLAVDSYIQQTRGKVLKRSPDDKDEDSELCTQFERYVKLVGTRSGVIRQLLGQTQEGEDTLKESQRKVRDGRLTEPVIGFLELLPLDEYAALSEEMEKATGADELAAISKKLLEARQLATRVTKDAKSAAMELASAAEKREQRAKKEAAAAAAQEKKNAEKADKAAAAAAAGGKGGAAGGAGARAGAELLEAVWPVFSKSAPAAPMVTVTGALSPQVLLEAFAAEGLTKEDVQSKPIAVRAVEATATLRKHADFSTAYDAYKFDSASVGTPGAKLMRGQRLKQNCVPAAEAFRVLGEVVGDLAATTEELLAAASLNSMANGELKLGQKYMSAGHFFYNVSPSSSSYIGPYFCYFRTATWTLEGSKHIVAAPLDAVRRLQPPGWALPAMSATAAALDGEGLADFLQQPGVYQLTAVPGDILLTPPAYCVLERTFGDPAWSMKKVQFPTRMPHFHTVAGCLSCTAGSENSVRTLLCLTETIMARRIKTPAQAAAAAAANEEPEEEARPEEPAAPPAGLPESRQGEVGNTEGCAQELEQEAPALPAASEVPASEVPASEPEVATAADADTKPPEEEHESEPKPVDLEVALGEVLDQLDVVGDSAAAEPAAEGAATTTTLETTEPPAEAAANAPQQAFESAEAANTPQQAFNESAEAAAAQQQAFEESADGVAVAAPISALTVPEATADAATAATSAPTPAAAASPAPAATAAQAETAAEKAPATTAPATASPAPAATAAQAETAPEKAPAAAAAAPAAPAPAATAAQAQAETAAKKAETAAKKAETAAKKAATATAATPAAAAPAATKQAPNNAAAAAGSSSSSGGAARSRGRTPPPPPPPAPPLAGAKRQRTIFECGAGAAARGT